MGFTVIEETQSAAFASEMVWVSPEKYTRLAKLPSIERNEGSLLWAAARKRLLSLSRIHNIRRPSRWFSYNRLPHNLRLSILKLDGSSFEVQVPGTSTILQLKQAVEGVFCHRHEAEEGNISWLHVWGHFCLCFGTCKLINDKACLQSFGIKDGDQLCFMRHLSLTDDVKTKRRCRNNRLPSRENTMFVAGLQDIESNSWKNKPKIDIDDEDYFDPSEEETDIIAHSEFKLGRLLRGWLSYSALLCTGLRKRSRRWNRPRRLIEE